MKKFILLKRTYPKSRFNRQCDGYDYIFKNSTKKERIFWEIDDNKLQRIIKNGERYIYQVAKENMEFKIMYLSFSNYEIIRKKIFNCDY